MRAAWYERQGPSAELLQVGDGVGVADAVGEGVDRSRVARRVWVYGAQSYRPLRTAAQLTVVPAEQAVELPDEVSDQFGACLGIPGITAHRAVFGGVGSLAAQLAHWAGATDIGTVLRGGDLERINASAVSHAVALDQTNPADAIRVHAPDGALSISIGE